MGRRCSRDTYLESYVTELTLVYEYIPLLLTPYPEYSRANSVELMARHSTAVAVACKEKKRCLLREGGAKCQTPSHHQATTNILRGFRCLKF